ncbi:hypothetical protein DL93DRAFT_560653 [Clavulina sp. PMI_390]|nr:hypothetical protein DL93DRAFT_560653 [Clavulina sp. PMI_390]
MMTGLDAVSETMEESYLHQSYSLLYQTKLAHDFQLPDDSAYVEQPYPLFELGDMGFLPGLPAETSLSTLELQQGDHFQYWDASNSLFAGFDPHSVHYGPIGDLGETFVQQPPPASANSSFPTNFAPFTPTFGTKELNEQSNYPLSETFFDSQFDFIMEAVPSLVDDNESEGEGEGDEDEEEEEEEEEVLEHPEPSGPTETDAQRREKVDAWVEKNGDKPCIGDERKNLLLQTGWPIPRLKRELTSVRLTTRPSPQRQETQ